MSAYTPCGRTASTTAPFSIRSTRRAAPNRIPEALFDRLRAQFSEAQIVELTLRITLCGFFNKFNDALQIEEEPEAVAGLTAASPSTATAQCR